MFNTPQELFDAMPAAFLPQKAGQVELALQFSLSGDHGGDWAVEISQGVCRTRPGEVEHPLAAIRSSGEDLVAIFNGQLNAVAAYMNGRVKVTGDVTAIMNLVSFFDLPGQG